MHITRLNVNAANNKLRKLKFKEGDETVEAEPPVDSNHVKQKRSYKPKLFNVLGLQAARMDRVSQYQKFLLSKLSHLHNLSEDKQKGSLSRRKNSSLQDKIFKGIMAVLDGKQEIAPRPTEPSFESKRYEPINASPRPKPLQRPSTVDTSTNNRQNRFRKSILCDSQIYVRVDNQPQQQQQQQPKQIIIKPAKLTNKFEELTPYLNPQLLASTHKHTSQSQNHYKPVCWQKSTTEDKIKDEVVVFRKKHSEEIKPWQSYELQQIAFS